MLGTKVGMYSLVGASDGLKLKTAIGFVLCCAVDLSLGASDVGRILPPNAVGLAVPVGAFVGVCVGSIVGT